MGCDAIERFNGSNDASFCNKKKPPIPTMREKRSSYEYAYLERLTSNLLSQMSLLTFPPHSFINSKSNSRKVSQIVHFLCSNAIKPSRKQEFAEMNPACLYASFSEVVSRI